MLHHINVINIQFLPFYLKYHWRELYYITITLELYNGTNFEKLESTKISEHKEFGGKPNLTCKFHTMQTFGNKK